MMWMPGEGNAFYCIIGFGLLCLMWWAMTNDRFCFWFKDRFFDACILLVLGAACGVGYELLTGH